MIGFDTYRRIHKALDLIASGAVDELEPGHYDLDEGIYVNVMEIETKDSGIFESHHQYADIHYPMIGSEQIELADEAGMAVTEAYDAEKDCVFGTAAGERYCDPNETAFCRDAGRGACSGAAGRGMPEGPEGGRQGAGLTAGKVPLKKSSPQSRRRINELCDNNVVSI